MQTEVRKPKAKRVKYVASRKTATGRGTSTTSPTPSLGIIEEDGERQRVGEVNSNFGLIFHRTWNVFV